MIAGRKVLGNRVARSPTNPSPKCREGTKRWSSFDGWSDNQEDEASGEKTDEEAMCPLTKGTIDKTG